MSLYQKYRPQTFEQVVGQEFITTSLKNALTKNKVTHAYLFHGPRGTGKTSIARIFAKALNCLDLSPEGNPCGKCAHCLAFDDATFFDVVELDAASHTGVDNIRELIEQMRFPPSLGQFKIYIIDEVHMLSAGAFNALLKTLEEPPVHGKFILATTEIHKVPETIISRTLRYDFRRISDQDIITRLQLIAQEEGFEADEKSLALIARFAKGGLRDAIGLLEQYASSGDLTLESVSVHLGMIDEDFLVEFLHHIAKNDESAVASDLRFLYERNVDMRYLIEQLLFALRNLIVSQKTDPTMRRFCIRAFDALEGLLVRIRYVPDMFVSFEMIIYSLLSGGFPMGEEVSSAAPITKKPISSAPAQKVASEKEIEMPTVKEEKKEKKEEKPSVPAEKTAEAKKEKNLSGKAF